MKKILFMSMAATALLASCSQDETVDMPQNSAAIQFKTFVNKSTKGANDDITNDKFTAFQVWGLKSTDGQPVKPFEGTLVSKDAQNNTWSYETPVYWEAGCNYSFVAIAPTTAIGTSAIFTQPTAVGQYGSITFENGDGTTDLIYDGDGTWATTAVTEGTCPNAINFTFNRLLSRVKFAFTNGMDDGSTINVTNVQITNANTKGIATLSENTATWTLAEDNNTAALEFGNVLDAEQEYEANETKATDHKYMIPEAGADAYTVTFTVSRTTPTGEQYTYNHEVELPTTVEMETGNSYQFIATLDAETIDPENPLCKIEFTATVSGWGDWNNTDLTVEQVADGQ